MSNQNHSPSESSTFGAIKRHPVRTAIIAIVVFIVWTLPLAIAQAWTAFVRDKTIPEWLAERRWPGMTAQVYGWLTIVFFLALAILLVVLIFISRRKEILPPPADATPLPESTPTTETATTAESERITKLEDEKATLERQHAKEIRGRDKAFDDLERRHDGLKGQLDRWERYDWLVSLAVVQAQDINDYVKVERVYICYQKLADAIPHIVFGVDIYNKSVFDIIVEAAMEGHIEIAGKPFLRDKRMIYRPGKIAPISRESVTIEQRLSPEEAALIKRCEDDVLGAMIYFRELVIMFKGGNKFPTIERTRLTLPEHICSADMAVGNWKLYEDEISELKSKVDSLTTQLEERDEYQLFLEVDTEPHYSKTDWMAQSKVHVIHEVRTFKIDEAAEPVSVDEYLIKAYIHVRFENKDPHQLLVYNLTASLIRKAESGEEVVPLSRTIIDANRDDRTGQFQLVDEQVAGRTRTPYYWLHCHFDMSPKHKNLLD